jgi:hypothetical protein
MSNAFDAARAHFEATIAECTEIAKGSGDLAAIEVKMHERNREQGRLLVEATVGLMSTRFDAASLAGADEMERGWRRMSTRTILTTFGCVAITRLGFHGKDACALFPLDGALNLPVDSRMSPALQRHVARESARGSYEQACNTVEAFLGVAPGKRQAEETALAAVLDFAAYYEAKTLKPDPEKAGDVLAMTTDAKGIVVRTEDLREPTRTKALTEKNKLSKRLSAGEKGNRKRMAQVAACYDVAPFKRTADDVVDELANELIQEKRPKPANKRVWAGIVDESETVIHDLFAEAKRRDPKGLRQWVMLLDGNRAQRQAVERLAKGAPCTVTIIADIIHVIEYIWSIVWLFFPEGAQAGQDWVTARVRMILQGKSKEVCRQIRRFAALRDLGTEGRRRVEVVVDYLSTMEPYLHYDVYLAQGFPIATGIIEGACRYLVKDRMDITGARWSVEGAEAVLRLRSLCASDDFEEYWKYHQEKEFKSNHAARYADPEMLRRTRIQAI